MSILIKVDPEVSEGIKFEMERQEYTIELIASENFVSEAVLEAQGSVLTNKYAEGYPGKRYYGGCEYMDMVEILAIERAKKLFNAEHVNVQPHSGTQANMAVYFSVLNPGDNILSMNLSHGGHLSHGSPASFSGKLYNVFSYGVDRETHLIDYDELDRLAKEHRPKLIIAGFSAYPRTLNYKKFREICDEVGAILMVDIAHIAGLIVAGLSPNPISYAEFVTTTTHKTLRGPRGGMVMCKGGYAKDIDSKIFPGMQGGPLMHVIAAKAVALKEALTEEFKEYQMQIVKNAKHLAKELINRGFNLISGGTDNHLILIDLTNMEITGKEAEKILEKAGITVNKNTIPFEKRTPFITSGIRIGTAAITTRGMKEKEMEIIVNFISEALRYKGEDKVLSMLRNKVKELCMEFPIYKDRLKLYIK